MTRIWKKPSQGRGSNDGQTNRETSFPSPFPRVLWVVGGLVGGWGWGEGWGSCIRLFVSFVADATVLLRVLSSVTSQHTTLRGPGNMFGGPTTRSALVPTPSKFNSPFVFLTWIRPGCFRRPDQGFIIVSWSVERTQDGARDKHRRRFILLQRDVWKQLLHSAASSSASTSTAGASQHCFSALLLSIASFSSGHHRDIIE